MSALSLPHLLFHAPTIFYSRPFPHFGIFSRSNFTFVSWNPSYDSTDHYSVPSLTLFCTITQFSDLIVNHETRLLSHLPRSILFLLTYSSHPIPSFVFHTPQSSHNPSPPPSPTTLHHLYTPFALPHITTIFG